jgi:hypothetical protein
MFLLGKVIPKISYLRSTNFSNSSNVVHIVFLHKQKSKQLFSVILLWRDRKNCSIYVYCGKVKAPKIFDIHSILFKNIIYKNSFFFLCSSGDWTQGLILTRQALHHVSNARSPFAFSVFQTGSYTFALPASLRPDSPISAPK